LKADFPFQARALVGKLFVGPRIWGQRNILSKYNKILRRREEKIFLRGIFKGDSDSFGRGKG
jgi:hypothetical protein